MPTSSKRILKIGVTGGIGSGKSTVCEIFLSLGVPVLYSDDMAKELSNTNPEIREQLMVLLGPDTYLDDGTLNRSFIASKIFSNKEIQRKVEAVIHPVVERERERRIQRLQKESHRMVIVEAALIYETGLDKKLDAVIVVDADETVRIKRTCARMGISEKEVRVRIDAQLDVKKKLAKAEYILRNDGTREELESKVRFLYTILQYKAYEGKRA